MNMYLLQGQFFIQTAVNNPGTIDIKHNGTLDANFLKLRYFFSLYSNAMGYTNRRLSIQNIDGEQAFIYNYDEGSKTYHTINIGGRNVLNSGLTIMGNGNVGIGVSNPDQKLNVDGDIKAKGLLFPPDAIIKLGTEDNATGELRIWNDKNCYNNYIVSKGNLYLSPKDLPGSSLGLQSDGTVVIGAYVRYDNSILDTKGSKLMVNGSILCKSLTIDTDVPSADDVFEDAYYLNSIEYVNTFIKQHKHLPDVPSSDEFKQNGYKIGEMDEILLRKIEELTLYVIDLKEENKVLNNKIYNLEGQLKVK